MSSSLRVDLHSHTTISDGCLTPQRLLQAAARAELEVFAVTDHDTTEGIPEARQAAQAAGIRLIPGMEISAHHGARNLHILAYFGDSAVPGLEGWQEERRQARRRRLEAMLDRLEALDLPVDRAAIAAEAAANPRRSPGRPHVARALIEAGHVANKQEAFDRYLGKGCPAYVDDRGPQAAEAIAMIQRLPGLAVVAHPVFDEVDEILDELRELGLDGVEAYHSSHEPDVAAHFHQRARDLGLLVSGGSDYHGEPRDLAAAHERLGAKTLPPQEWARFDEALRARVGT